MTKLKYDNDGIVCKYPSDIPHGSGIFDYNGTKKALFYCNTILEAACTKIK